MHLGEWVNFEEFEDFGREFELFMAGRDQSYRELLESYRLSLQVPILRALSYSEMRARWLRPQSPHFLTSVHAGQLELLHTRLLGARRLDGLLDEMQSYEI